MESLNRIVIKKHEINRAFCFKPYFIWSAPYTLPEEKENTLYIVSFQTLFYLVGSLYQKSHS